MCSCFISHLSQSCPSASAVSVLTMGLQLAFLLLAVAKQQTVDNEARKTYAIHNTVHHFPPKIKNKTTKYLTSAAVWGLKCIFIPAVQRSQQGMGTVQWILGFAQEEESWVCYWWCV